MYIGAYKTILFFKLYQNIIIVGKIILTLRKFVFEL